MKVEKFLKSSLYIHIYIDYILYKVLIITQNDSHNTPEITFKLCEME